MADQESTPSSSLPSLQEHCEKEALELILRSTDLDADFLSLNPHFQKLILGKLRIEVARLREAEKKLRLVTENGPSTDLLLRCRPPRIQSDEVEEERDGHINTWSYVDESDYPEHFESKEIGWAQGNLIAESPDSELRLCLHGRRGSPCPCPPNANYCNPLSERVSSQLLLYRLTATFEMPPPRESDGYKSCWEVELKHGDGISLLHFSEHKGAASIRFDGTAKASMDAVKLANYLSGMQCLHTYDGIVAGTEA